MRIELACSMRKKNSLQINKICIDMSSVIMTTILRSFLWQWDNKYKKNLIHEHFR